MGYMTTQFEVSQISLDCYLEKPENKNCYEKYLKYLKMAAEQGHQEAILQLQTTKLNVLKIQNEEV